MGPGGDAPVSGSDVGKERSAALQEHRSHDGSPPGTSLKESLRIRGFGSPRRGEAGMCRHGGGPPGDGEGAARLSVSVSAQRGFTQPLRKHLVFPKESRVSRAAISEKDLELELASTVGGRSTPPPRWRLGWTRVNASRRSSDTKRSVILPERFQDLFFQ